MTKGAVVLDTSGRPLSTAGIRGALFKRVKFRAIHPHFLALVGQREAPNQRKETTAHTKNDRRQSEKRMTTTNTKREPTLRTDATAATRGNQH